MSETPDVSIPASERTVAAMLPRESVRSVYIDMVYCPDGPVATKGSELRELATGTAFFYESDGADYLITAWHNVTGKHPETGEYLGEYAVSPTHFRLTFLAPPPTKAGWQLTASPGNPTTAQVQMPISQYLLPLLREDWSPAWLEHPALGKSMDVVALSLARLPARTVLSRWNEPRTGVDMSQEIEWPRLSAGADVFIVGFPYRISTGPFLPLWIRGTIASEPTFGHMRNGEILPLMLVDARTRKSQSGSPVIRHVPMRQFVIAKDGKPGLSTGNHSELVGVYSGRTSDESDLGFVWFVDQIDEIVKQDREDSSLE